MEKKAVVYLYGKFKSGTRRNRSDEEQMERSQWAVTEAGTPRTERKRRNMKKQHELMMNLQEGSPELSVHAYEAFTAGEAEKRTEGEAETAGQESTWWWL